jgi:hypothetical protein
MITLRGLPSRSARAVDERRRDASATAGIAAIVAVVALLVAAPGAGAVDSSSISATGRSCSATPA